MMRFNCNSELTHARLDCVLVALNQALERLTNAYSTFVKAVDLDPKTTTAKSAIYRCAKCRLNANDSKNSGRGRVF